MDAGVGSGILQRHASKDVFPTSLLPLHARRQNAVPPSGYAASRHSSATC